MKRYVGSSHSSSSSSVANPSSPDNNMKRAKVDLLSTNFLRVCSYNVDGLDDLNISDRANEVCSILLQEEPDGFLPDVILLQEIVQANFPVFVSRLCSAGYVLAPSSIPEDNDYFTLAFFNGARIQITRSMRTPFSGSNMGRDLIKVEGRLALGAADETPFSSASSREFLFMTSHFESLGPGSAERCRQLTQILENLLSFPGPALFAGDTNLREGEVKACEQYKKVVDAWMAAGSPAAEKVTWDMSINDNLKMDGASFLPRMRLDRLLLNWKWGGIGTTTASMTAADSNKGCGGGKGKKKAAETVKERTELVRQWKLLGKARMADGRFPSDHFGISCLVRLPASGV